MKKNKKKKKYPKQANERMSARIELFVCLTHRQVLVLLIAVMNVYIYNGITKRQKRVRVHQ